MRALIESNGIEVTISEDKRNLFDQILSVLENGSGTIGLNVIKCKYLINNKFNGIISYIKRISEDIVDGKNDHLRLSGGGNYPNYPLSNLLLYGDKDIYNIYINGYNGEFLGKNAYIEFDFVNRKINMTSYTIRTAYNPKNAYHPKTLKMIGSNDHINWEIIDMRENNDELNDMSKCAHFECSTTTGKYYRIIRYVQMENWGTIKYSPFSHYVGLSAIEFFGSITSFERKQ
ncbi:hypothetical protein M9Y10_030729 [Tritrichomonas musculus]|uniref:F5/8 type C domain-containing protein n=1 Tax=Tritrichomonas musculus TaxID=1915356 RepID=A0ABR2H2Z0_9EUKA